MKFFNQNHRLYAENDGNPSGNTPPEPAPGPPGANVNDIAKMLESMSNNFTKSISDMRKELQDKLKATDDRLRLVVDDILEVTSQPKSAPPPVLPPTTTTQTAPAPTTDTASTEDAIKLATFATRRKWEQAEEAKKQLELQVAELTRDNRQTRIESAINSAMAKLQWADGAVSDLVASQMISKAEIDADGKVKIGGAEPFKYINDYWTNARWAQPAPVNAGSGNAGTTVRDNKGNIDLSTYNAAKVEPGSEEHKKLIEQAKRYTGMSTS